MIRLRLLMWLLLLCVQGAFAYQLLEIHNILQPKIADSVILGQFDIQLYGNRFSIKEWWEKQPLITFSFEGEQAYKDEIETVLQNLGFVFGEGKSLIITARKIQDRFLYLESTYESNTITNSNSLFMITKDLNKQFKEFFQSAYGQHGSNLPKLILIHTHQMFQVNGDILYRGPEYSVVKIFDQKMDITIENENLQLELPFSPVMFLDLTQTQFRLTLKSAKEQTVFIDGIAFKAPIQIYLDEGVHELQYSDHSQYLYLTKDTQLMLDDIEEASLQILLNVTAKITITKDGKEFSSVESDHHTFTIPPGDYQIAVEKTGYINYEEDFCLISAQKEKFEINLKPNPGQIIYRINLTEPFPELYFKGNKIILTKPEHSVVIDIKKDEILAIPIEVLRFDGELIVTDQKIMNCELQTLFSTDDLIIDAIETKNALWLFTSDKKVISVDLSKWSPQWTRMVNYLPLRTITLGANVCILDPFSRVILINTELGYRDFFDYRVPGVEDIRFIEDSSEKISIYLEGCQSVIDYYYKSKSIDLRKGFTIEKTIEFQQIGDQFYQNDQPLISIKGSLIKAVKEQDFLAVLTDQEILVCTSY
ncbi:MAG TPA: hypothetical protein PLI77_08055 [Bacteroidales bacterium]|nr:hypothetical protein [Bacteroidales bacterium]HRW33510.1 hypothetical protein [Thermotogota bacterium]